MQHVETDLRSVYPCAVVKDEDCVYTIDVEASLLGEDRLVEQYNDSA